MIVVGCDCNPKGSAGNRQNNLTKAMAMARSYMGRNAEKTMLHQMVIEVCNVTD